MSLPQWKKMPELKMTFKVDGGASANNMLMKFQADIAGNPCRAPEMH